jgi:AraC-like DNA-binding protein
MIERHLSDVGPQDLTMRHLSAADWPRPVGLANTIVPPWTVISAAYRGHYRVSRNGRTFEGTPGTVIVSPPNRPTRFEHFGDAGGEFWARTAGITFTLWGGVDVTSLVELPDVLDGDSTEAVHQTISDLLEPRPGLSAIAESAARLSAGVRLLGVVLERSRPLPAAPAVVDGARRLAPLISAMRDRLADPLDIDALSRLGNVSRASLHRHFAAAFGVTPMRYLKNLRLEEAAHRLAMTELMPRAIAAEVGFVNPFHFVREFTARFGVTPTTYRRDRMAGAS